MDHVQIKSNQIAASYVANGLDEHTQEQFELHMLGCSDCLSDVEAWRAIKLHMPREAAPRTYLSQRRNWWGGWGIAASVAAATLTAVSGWYARELYQPDVETMHTAFFSAPALTRSDDCTPLRYAPETRSIILRVPRVREDRRVAATDVEGVELSAGYSARAQADGSWILQFDPQTLQGRAVQLETRSGNFAEALGCVTGEAVAAR
jgi:hypothetical protein